MFLSSFAVLALIPCISASFPGSTFGIAYNSSSPVIPSPGHLTTVKTSPESTTFFTTVSDSTQDIGGFFTMSGTKATLNNACSGGGIAALVPVDPPVAGLKFLLQWSTETSTLPAGSNFDGFILGPSPTYDTLQNENTGAGSWVLARFGDKTSPLVVGWSDEEVAGIPITLVKTDITNIAPCN